MMKRSIRKPNPNTLTANLPTARATPAGSLFPGVVQRPINSLILNPRNARKHSREQLHRLKTCIATFGFLVPILIDDASKVILGHGRLEAAVMLGLTHVPVLMVAGLAAGQLRAFAIAENRLSDLADWDYDTLRLEFSDLLELQVDIEDTAFSTGEVDLLLDEGKPTPDDGDQIPQVDRDNVVSEEGDVWLLGPHRVLCGNALIGSNYERLLGVHRANMVFTDPPYNVPIDGHVGGLGKVKHREFAMASGEMSSPQFTRFLVTVFHHLANCSQRGSIHYICMDWRHLQEVLAAGRDAYSEFKNLCVWNKTNAGMGSFYRSKHELVLVFQNGAGRFQNNVALGGAGRYRTNVWDYAGMNTMAKGRMDELTMHPTVKPVPLVADAIRDCTKRAGLVVDPFLGSGTTLMAAERTGRICYGMELDPYPSAEGRLVL
jgi:DNA modification methylase